MKIQKMLYAVALFLLPLVLVAQGENWVYRYNSPENLDDVAKSIVYCADGNLYAAGYSYDGYVYRGLMVISLTPAGTERWVYRYNEPGTEDTFALAHEIIYGEDGNIYATGRSIGSEANDDIIVISLDAAGTENWVYRYNGSGNDYDEAYSIIYGADGNLYIAGSSTGIGTDNDYTIISLTTSGAENWVYTYNGPANQYDNAYDIVFGSDGNLYATGYSCGIGSEMDITVISLTTSGGERWVYRYNGLGNARDRTRSIIYGADGNIYTGGYAIGAGTAYDFAVISLTSSGTARWIYLYDGPISSTDRCNCIVYGADGNIYGCGHSIDSPTGFDGVVISLTSSGIERWVYRYDRQGMQFGFEELWSLVYGPDSNIYIGGYSGEEEPMLYDFTVISLTSSGTENWVYWYDGLGDGNDSAYDIVYGADGNLYAAGFGGGGGTDIDFTVISLNPEVYVSEKTNYTVDFFDLHCSPNPFSAKTVIEFELPACSEISLKIFDITGSIVRTLFSEGRPKGRYRVVWDGRDNQGENIPSGIYFYQLETENRTAIRKVLKVL